MNIEQNNQGTYVYQFQFVENKTNIPTSQFLLTWLLNVIITLFTYYINHKFST